MADGNPGQEGIDRLRGGLGHPAAAAGGAESAPLAGEGDQAIQTAGVAVDPDEAVGQDAAVEEGAKLPLHEAGYRTLLLPGPVEEGLEVLADRPVQDGLLGPPWPILEPRPARIGGR